MPVIKKPAATKGTKGSSNKKKMLPPPGHESGEEEAPVHDAPAEVERTSEVMATSEVEAPSEVMAPAEVEPRAPDVNRVAPGTPPDTPGAMGSEQPLPAVKNEPGTMPLSKADARATQQKLLTYLKRDVKRGDTQAQAAQAAWSEVISGGDESSRLAFLKEFAQNA
eukprot:6312261-Amphidinium_carterae.1